MQLSSGFCASIVCATLLALPASHAQLQSPPAMLEAAGARAKAGSDPVADANAAARRGEFGLIVTTSANGVICFAPRYIEVYVWDDNVDFDENATRWFQYASAYNRTLVEHAGFPDRDVCRTSVPGDPWSGRSPDTPARSVSGPARSLHAAARRGTAAEIRLFLRSADANALDAFGMTPLDWAVARNNDAAIDALVSAGANPWTSYQGWQQNSLYWAAAFGRQREFERLARLPGRPWDRWPAIYLNAALSGGNRPIIEHILSEPHEKFRLEMQPDPLPPPDLLRLLGDELSVAALMGEGALGRPDVLRFALENGADPNALPGGRETPLGLLAKGFHTSSLETVDILVKAGADPNRLSHRDRPIWQSIRMLTLDGKFEDHDRRVIEIMDRLIEAGADINLPNDQGVPTVWQLFFPRYYDRTIFDPSFVTPELLELLVGKGLDLNRPWQGRNVLGAVEEQAGANSELATTLRRFGARR